MLVSCPFPAKNTFLKSAIEIPEKGMKYVQSY